MSWLEPKTNWQSTDYINIEDFNRIKNNIQYLKTQADSLYPPFDFSIEEEKTYSDIPYANAWNGLENSLQSIVDNTYDLNIGNKKTYRAYDAYIDYKELNRIESACLNYYKLFESQHNTIEKLSFRLGNHGGIKI